MPCQFLQSQGGRATVAGAHCAGSLTVSPDCLPGTAPLGARDLPHPSMRHPCLLRHRTRLTSLMRLPAHSRAPAGRPQHSGSQEDRRVAWSLIEPTRGSTSPCCMPLLLI